ncbi:restriction endonuclease subunit S [Fortiea contorta]|uniref:restriction endonuclease subunit S n=1 Tax=Fortiea contorta TaxID=1892405 RepID=UPI000347EC4B|nr:restriction endonuclease subunit S [Fortiea contorta]
MRLTVGSRQLPVEWEIKTIGEVCKTGAGGTPLKSKKEYYEGGHIPWLLSGEVAQGEIFKSENFITPVGLENSSAKIFPVNTVLVAMYGATAGQVGILRFEAATNQAVCGILPNERFVPEFIYYVLLSKRAELISKAVGNAQPNISQIKIKNTKIPIPTLSEQKRIVAILDEAFEGIDRAIANTEKNLANSRELFESYLNAIFTQKGDEWITTTVGKLVDQRILDKPLDGNHGEIHPKKSDFVKFGVPFIMASDLVDGIVDQVNCNFITLEQANSLRKGFAKDGDVLLSHKGTIGRAAVLKTTHSSVVLTPQVTYYRVIDKSVIYNRYLYYFFHSPYFQNEIKTIAGAGSTRAYIGITSQLQLKISYPKIDDQKRYADSFDALISETQRLETIYRQKIAALKELKQSILQTAFTGELTADTPKTAKQEIAA